MAINFGGLPTECYICCRKPRKLQAISLWRFGALLPLVHFAQPAEVRLRSALVPPFAQNDIQWFYLVVCVRKNSGRPMVAPTKNILQHRSILNSALCILHSSLPYALHLKIIFSLRIKLPIRRERALKMCQALRP